MLKKERIKNFELKAQHKSILIFDITQLKTVRKPNYQYLYSYIDVEVNPKRCIPSGTRFIDANGVIDFKEKLSKLFTKALKRGLSEQVIPEHIFSQVENSWSPSKRKNFSTFSIYYRNLITRLKKHFYRAKRYRRTNRGDIKVGNFVGPIGTRFSGPTPEEYKKAYKELEIWNKLIVTDPVKARELWNKHKPIK